MTIKNQNDCLSSSNVTPHRDERRRLLAKLMVGGAAATALPVQWSKPVVDTVLLPVHAQTSPATRVRTISGGGGVSSQSGSLAPSRSFARNLVDYIIPTARAVGAFSAYCVEIDVEEIDGEVTAVTVTKYCWDACGPGQWVDRTTGPFDLTYDSGADEWSGKADGDCCTLRIFNIDTSSGSRLADVIYGGIPSTIVPGNGCDCSCDT
jgi:hypothetical protein